MRICLYVSIYTHNLYLCIQELDNELRKSKEKFKDFERQDVKHREDLKHLKQKIKKLDDKFDKVWKNDQFVSSMCINLIFCLLLQDSTKIDDLRKECEESTSLIPKLEESIPQFQKLLSDEEKILEEIQENSKGSSIFSVNVLDPRKFLLISYVSKS